MQEFVGLDDELSTEDEQEMREFDAEAEAEEQYQNDIAQDNNKPSDEDNSEAATTKPAAFATPIATNSTLAEAKPSKPKEMEDNECACKPETPNNKEKAKIDATNAKHVKAAADATAKATADRVKAEAAIKTAVTLKKKAETAANEMTRKAQETARIAAKADVKANNAAAKASVKVVAKGKGKTEQDVKVKTKTWEETVVQKHEVWKTYSNIRKNVKIATQNLKNVNQNLRRAEAKIS